MSDLPSWARVGAKVVYVGDRRFVRAATEQLAFGKAYTIRSIFVGYAQPIGGAMIEAYAIRLQEVTNGIHRKTGVECGYVVSGFRPLVTLEDDIKAHFSQHLHAPQKIVERAS